MAQLDYVNAPLAGLTLGDEALRASEGSRHLRLGELRIDSGAAQPAEELLVLLTVAFGLQGG